MHRQCNYKMFNKQKRSDLFLWRVCSRTFATKRSLGQTKGRYIWNFACKPIKQPEDLFFSSSFGAFMCARFLSLFNCGTKPIKINWIYCIRWKCYVIWRPRRTRNTNNKTARWYDTSMLRFVRGKRKKAKYNVNSVSSLLLLLKSQLKRSICDVACTFFGCCCRSLGLVLLWFCLLLPHWKMAFAGASQSSLSLFVTRNGFFWCWILLLFFQLLYRQLILWTIYSSIRRNKRFARNP